MANATNGNILIIEDEASIADSLGEYFTGLGYQVFFSKTATDAVLKCQNQKFNCILTDINLEKGTGDTVILNIKTSPFNPNFATPIIIVSSVIDMQLMSKVVDVIDWAFVKPYSLQQLGEKVHEVCGKPAKIHKSNSV